MRSWTELSQFLRMYLPILYHNVITIKMIDKSSCLCFISLQFTSTDDSYGHVETVN